MRDTLTVYITICRSDKRNLEGRIKVFYTTKKAQTYINNQIKKYEKYNTYFELFKKNVVE